MLVSSVPHSDSVIYIVFSRLFSLTGYYKLLSRVPCACWLFIYSSVSVQFNHSVVSNSLRPHGLQHARLPCPSPTPRACSNSCPSSQWCYPTILSISIYPEHPTFLSIVSLKPCQYRRRSQQKLCGGLRELEFEKVKWSMSSWSGSEISLLYNRVALVFSVVQIWQWFWP